MSKPKNLAWVICGLILWGPPAWGQDAPPRAKMEVLRGPTNAPLGAFAKVAVPEGYVFLDGKSTRAMMKAAGEPTNGHELGFLRPTNDDWSVFFEFREVGYVKDDEKDKLDADKLLAAIKQGTARANEERRRNGSAPLEIVGWEKPPKYDDTTHNLEWAIRATSEGRPILNYNTRLLGRKGVMEVVLVVAPENFAETLPSFRRLLAGYSYQSGENYAEFRAGDKVAAYGLGALVVGGAAVGAAKLGLFAWLAVFFKKGAKLLIVALVAIVAFFRRLFTGRRSGTQQ